MNKLVKRIIIIFSSGVIVGLAVFGAIRYFNYKTVHISCDYPYYDSLEKMIDSSNIIANGVVISYRVTRMNVGAGKMKYRTYDLEVTECIKGNAKKGDIIPIKILATDKSKNLLKKNNEYICFLVTYNNNIPASLINIEQSAFYVEENNIILTDIQKNTIEKSVNINSNIKSFNSQDFNNSLSKDSFTNLILNYLN